ncbi:retrotransposon ORF1 [Tanacetum coccineum]
MQQLWYTLQLADSKESFTFKLDTQYVEFTLDNFRTLLNLPQATDNNKEGFVELPELLTICEFLQIIGDENHRGRSSIAGKIANLLLNHQQFLCDYAKLIWDGIHYQLMNPSSKHMLVPYLRFTKLIVQHSLTKFPDIPRRTNEPSHTVEDDVVVGFMIASGNVEAKGVRILDELLSEYMMSTWMTFRGNTRDLGSFGEETDEITDLHQILEEVLLTERGDGVVSIKRRHRDLFSDSVWNLETASGRGRLKEDL